MLVFHPLGAKLTALWNFTLVANPSDLVNPTIGNAMVVLNGVQLSGVISPGGPTKGIVDCSNINPNFYLTNTVLGMAPTGSISTGGPDGVISVSSTSTYFDGFTVMRCGLTSANLALFKTTTTEAHRLNLGYGGIRGIWVIITTKASIHNNNIFGSGKFAIDLDANSGPFTMINANHIYNNSYQAVFIEQGSQYGVVTGNNLGPGNQNSVSFFNNLFVPTAAGHVIHENLLYNSVGAGLNIGSISCAIGVSLTAAQTGGAPAICSTGYSPTQDCYAIGNTGWGNSLQYIGTTSIRKGVSSNGPAIGIVLAHNLDSQGIDPGTTLTKLVGGMVIVDPMFRMYIAGKSNTHSNVPAPTAPYNVVNMTISGGNLYKYNFAAGSSGAPIATGIT
jgi:hypothetical protein